MTAERLALPQRSPIPIRVPWTCEAPASTAMTELATAIPSSLWQWMPIGRANARTALAVRSPTSEGNEPPFVSQRTRQSAPPSAAAWRARKA